MYRYTKQGPNIVKRETLLANTDKSLVLKNGAEIIEETKDFGQDGITRLVGVATTKRDYWKNLNAETYRQELEDKYEAELTELALMQAEMDS